MRTVILIAIAGAFGAIARYALSWLVTVFAGAAFPWGVFVVNVLGCFLFGIVWSVEAEYKIIAETTRLILLTGFMGSFTTFSTFVFDSQSLLAQGKIMPLCLNMAGQLILGLMALRLGMMVAGVVFSHS